MKCLRMTKWLKIAYTSTIVFSFIHHSLNLRISLLCFIRNTWNVSSVASLQKKKIESIPMLNKEWKMARVHSVWQKFDLFCLLLLMLVVLEANEKGINFSLICTHVICKQNLLSERNVLSQWYRGIIVLFVVIHPHFSSTTCISSENVSTAACHGE